MQIPVLIITFALMALIAYFFIGAVIASKSERPTPYTERSRASLMVWMLFFGAVITVASLWHWPHAIAAGDKSTTINVTGAQWYWEIDKAEVPLGKPVVFNAHTQDVTHGLGVVDSDGRILFQAQAMPGYVNQVQYIFSRPGTYRVVCLEYCGLAHHDMLSEFKAVND
ncbi:MAG: hypothetical protein KDJ45_09365 [Hyphomicrobiaceae bacterium]|nr:hypothetical protein [Hyphomicrobiaceae bacterium]